MLRWKNIYFSYSKDNELIKNLNIDIPKGKITTILGPNGCGKSTLLSVLCCLNKPQIGEVMIENINLGELKYKE
ncbi:MAG: ATP-binding cassette domain-containing protein, partial [Peptostreptococcaceae bacterium]